MTARQTGISDVRSTTGHWRKNPTDILVLPVGSMEQHGPHLPLATDCIEVDYFARKVAAALSAALLPVLPIATSMEHSGFRGSFSLRPETLMQTIRDLVDEAGRQAFRIVLLLNGHGGNHALVPVCRDINRQDGPVKVILAHPLDFADTSLLDASHRTCPSIHAAEIETSVMLVLAPELVGDARPNMPPPAGDLPLAQPDLTMFGIAHFNPEGVIGRAETASRAKGEALLQSAETGLLRYLRDRIARLRNNRTYGGQEEITHG